MYRDLLESDDRSFTGFDLDSGYVFTSLQVLPCSVTIFSPLSVYIGLFSIVPRIKLLFHDW